MRKSGVLVLTVILTVLFCSFTYPNSNASEYGGNYEENVSKDDTVTYNMIFVAYDRSTKQTIEGVKLVIIDRDGKVVNTLTTDKSGKAERNITAPLDKKYYNENSYGSIKRGTVTAIAYKEGFCEAVFFEVPVSAAGSYQPFAMNPVVPGQRNEPEPYLADNHHIETGSLVDKYRQYINK